MSLALIRRTAPDPLALAAHLPVTWNTVRVSADPMHAFFARVLLQAFAPQAADPNVLAFLKGRFDAAAGILDRHLAGSKFVLGDKPTIADFSIAGYVFYPLDDHGYDWAKSHPNIHVWSERMRALPGWKNPYELMPGERIKPLR